MGAGKWKRNRGIFLRTRREINELPTRKGQRAKRGGGHVRLSNLALVATGVETCEDRQRDTQRERERERENEGGGTQAKTANEEKIRIRGTTRRGGKQGRDRGWIGPRVLRHLEFQTEGDRASERARWNYILTASFVRSDQDY